MYLYSYVCQCASVFQCSLLGCEYTVIWEFCNSPRLLIFLLQSSSQALNSDFSFPFPVGVNHYLCSDSVAAADSGDRGYLERIVCDISVEILWR